MTGEFCGKTELFQEQVFNIHVQRNQPTLFRECTIASTSECVEMSTYISKIRPLKFKETLIKEKKQFLPQFLQS